MYTTTVLDVLVIIYITIICLLFDNNIICLFDNNTIGDYLIII